MRAEKSFEWRGSKRGCRIDEELEERGREGGREREREDVEWIIDMPSGWVIRTKVGRTAVNERGR